MDCRVRIAQLNPRLGDLHANLAEHLRAAEAARGEADVLVFPELSLTGYFLKDQVFELALDAEAPELAQLCAASKDVALVVGYVERCESGRLYNAMAWFEDGELKGVHRKVHLVTYGMFEEARDFAAGETFEVIASKHGRFGPLICEDLWHMPGGYLHFLDDADALLCVSAPPARGVEAPGPGLGSTRTWDVLLTAAALMYRTWVVYGSRVGWEDGIGFCGGSCVIDPFGQLVERLSELEPGELTARLDSAALHRARMETPLRRDEKPWVLAADLVRHVPLLHVDPTYEEQG